MKAAILMSKPHLVLGKHLDLAPYNVDAALVGGVQLENTILDGIAQHFACKGHDARRLADTRGSLHAPFRQSGS